MKNITKVLLGISIAVIVGMVGVAFALNWAVKWQLMIFLLVGSGVALLRLFVNGMIKRMKGKHIGIKIAFFAALLSVGIPFQNWFRTDVLLALDRSFLVPCVIVTASSAVVMTIAFEFFGQRRQWY